MLGKRMEDHIRFAVAYWHTFAWPGGDPFGGQHLRAARGSTTAWRRAKLKADVAFEIFDMLDAPFFCFHDADVAPEGDDARREQHATSTRSSTSSRSKMETPATKLLWGTANLFSNRRYMAGAATNPDPRSSPTPPRR